MQRPPRGVLLHGPPGCAKTTLCRAAAAASGATFIPLSGAELYSKFVGEGEALLREAFRRARLAAPAIVFVDELDTVVGRRGAGAGRVDASSRLLSTFLTEMDGLELAQGVLVLATTNRPHAIDAALLRRVFPSAENSALDHLSGCSAPPHPIHPRTHPPTPHSCSPGRFDVSLYVPPPDEPGRLAALRLHTSRTPLASDVDLAHVAQRTEVGQRDIRRHWGDPPPHPPAPSM